MNKKQWRKYTSEEGESWTIFSDKQAVEAASDSISQEGNEAVMCQKFVAADYVVVSFIPCASNQEINNRDVNYDPYKKDFFHLHLELMNGDDWFCFSQQQYTKEEIVELASLFIGLSKHQAERVWKSKKLGAVNTYRIDRS